MRRALQVRLGGGAVPAARRSASASARPRARRVPGGPTSGSTRRRRTSRPGASRWPSTSPHARLLATSRRSAPRCARRRGGRTPSRPPLLRSRCCAFASKREKEWREEELVPYAACSRRRARSGVRWGPGERERAERLVAAIGAGALLAPGCPAGGHGAPRSRAGSSSGRTPAPPTSRRGGSPDRRALRTDDPSRFAPVGPRVSLFPSEPGGYNRGSGTHAPPAALLSQSLTLLR